MGKLTIQLADPLQAALEEISRQKNCAVEDLARDMVEKALFLVQLRKARQELRPYAQAAGFNTDEDVFKAVS